MSIVATRSAVTALARCLSMGTMPAGSNVHGGKTASTSNPLCQPSGHRVVAFLNFGTVFVKITEWFVWPLRSSTYSDRLMVVAGVRSSTSTAIRMSSGLTEQKRNLVAIPGTVVTAAVGRAGIRTLNVVVRWRESTRVSLAVPGGWVHGVFARLR